MQQQDHLAVLLALLDGTLNLLDRVSALPACLVGFQTLLVHHPICVKYVRNLPMLLRGPPHAAAVLQDFTFRQKAQVQVWIARLALQESTCRFVV